MEKPNKLTIFSSVNDEINNLKLPSYNAPYTTLFLRSVHFRHRMTDFLLHCHLSALPNSYRKLARRRSGVLYRHRRHGCAECAAGITADNAHSGLGAITGTKAQVLGTKLRNAMRLRALINPTKNVIVCSNGDFVILALLLDKLKFRFMLPGVGAALVVLFG